MTHTFTEATVGGVLVAPFALYLAAALGVHLLLRPLLARLDFDRLFYNPPVAQLCLFVLILGSLIVLL